MVSAPIEQGSFASYNKVDSPNYIEVQLAKQGTDDVLQAALKTLDSIPPEVIRFYENRTQEPAMRHDK